MKDQSGKEFAAAVWDLVKFIIKPLLWILYVIVAVLAGLCKKTNRRR